MSDASVLPAASPREISVERGFGVVISPDGMRLFSGMRDTHGVAVTDVATGALVTVLGKAGDADGEFNGVRKLCVVPGETSTLLVVDQGHNRVTELGFDGSYRRALGGGELDGPHGVCVFENMIAVTEWTGHRVSVFDYATGALVTRFGSPGSAPGCLASPCGIAYDPVSHELFVTDQGNHRVSVFVWDGSSVRFSRLLAASAGLSSPGDVTLLPAQALAIVDKGNNRVVIMARGAAHSDCALAVLDGVSSPTSATTDGKCLYVLQREVGKIVCLALP